MPTVEAEVLYPKAVSILDDLRSLKEEIKQLGTNVSGKLIIGASTIPGAYILPRLAANFKKKYPKISFEIRTYDSADVVSAVENNELLLGIVGAKLPSKKLYYHPFADDNLTLITSTENKIASVVTLEDLYHMDFLQREEGSGTRKSIEKFLSEKGSNIEQLNTVATLGSSTAIKEAVQSNLGVSIISSYAIQEAVAAHKIDTIQIEGLNMKRSFFTVTTKKRTLPNHYQLFLDDLLQSQEPHTEV